MTRLHRRHITGASDAEQTGSSRAEHETTSNTPQEEQPRLSVIIPMYNETGRIHKSLPQVVDYFSQQTYLYEIIVVDDGSTDGSADLARELLAPLKNLRVLEERPNRGKGHAVKVGMLASRGKVALFLDADLSIHPSELSKFWTWLDKGYDVVIASRKMRGARCLHHQPAWRENLGKGFTWLTNVMATRNISDVTTGFKCFTHEAAHELFARSVIDNWSFDAEVLYLAQQRHCRIKEVPVTWHDEPGTKVRLWKAITTSMAGLIAIRCNIMRGIYK